MYSLLGILPHFDLAGTVEKITNTLTNAWSPFFNAIQAIGSNLTDGLTHFLQAIPPTLFLVACAVFAYWINRKQHKMGLSVFIVLGLWFIYNQNLWVPFMDTLSLIIISSLLSIIMGVPMGIIMAKSDIAQSIIKPILDFMQTMPAFVYLIPAVAFFGIGVVPGIFASIIFALPPTVRFTNLGIRQVPKELTEAADSYGSTEWQKLIKLDLPIAHPTIMAGINQTIMLSLSMVVIASMIGAPGLGRDVLSALQRAQVGNGFVAGLGIVILAIIIDRFAQKLNKHVDKQN
ncbi:ABC transporter permease [Pectinatus sottacetonis]|uniref:ABC transporter permease n=1 Tax=Pectinatus sottacetonis TaxID=1002795 RepID=UPI0018C80E22|nr:proline/glycine betaine ABC transporter permease [Pectinatus sottacetonis]